MATKVACGVGVTERRLIQAFEMISERLDALAESACDLSADERTQLADRLEAIERQLAEISFPD